MLKELYRLYLKDMNQNLPNLLVFLKNRLRTLQNKK